MVSYHQAQTVACPKCGAEEMEPCVSVSKKPVWHGNRFVEAGDVIRVSHRERRRAWHEGNEDGGD